MKASRRASASLKLALEFPVLTAARSAEVRKTTWDKIDVEGAAWTLPAERIKANREHRVPLSRRACDVLAEAEDLLDGSGLVFPGARRGRLLSENTHAKLLRELGFDAVTHGFRPSFHDWASERTHTPRAVMEAAVSSHDQEQGGGGLFPQRSIREAAGIDAGMGRISSSYWRWD